jgi:hypothetical protein
MGNGAQIGASQNESLPPLQGGRAMKLFRAQLKKRTDNRSVELILILKDHI